MDRSNPTENMFQEGSTERDFSSHFVHQATGMVIAHNGVAADEAFRRLMSYAIEVNVPVDRLARQIVDRVIPLP